MRAYFDNNIIIYIENGTQNLKDLLLKADTRIKTIYYSSTHLHEAAEIKGVTEEQRTDRIERRLATIEAVTESNYLYQDLENNVFYQVLKPASVLSTIREVPFARTQMKILSNLISEDQRELARSMLGLEPSRLNNYTSTEVIEQLNKKLTNWGSEYSFMKMIETALGFHPQGKTFGLSHRIAGVFELLDMLGYWKDEPTGKSNYARLWDSSHTFFASFCDYFVSDDKRTRNKAKVVYDIYGIKRRVISSKGLE